MTISPLSKTQSQMLVQIAQVVPRTCAEGPGERFAVWFQGCPFRCPGCCNPEMLSFEGGCTTTVGQLVEELRQALDVSPGLEGITLLGGEPFAHAEAAALLAGQARALELSVMIFSGYRLEELETHPDAAVRQLLNLTDLLVDGLYEQDKPDHTRRWIGSTNQRVHCLSDRYSLDDEFWRQPDTLEIRWENRQLSINGFPARSAVGIWKRIPSTMKPSHENR